MSEPELLLWWGLQRRLTGYYFRRQVPIGPYVADFACLKHRLIVEGDGDTHLPDDDAQRDGWFAQRGFRTLRVDAADVYRDVDDVISWIVEEIERLSCR